MSPRISVFAALAASFLPRLKPETPKFPAETRSRLRDGGVSGYDARKATHKKA
jgi:hypothetical protein